MSTTEYKRLGALPDNEAFLAYLRELGLELPFDPAPPTGAASPLAQPLSRGGVALGNRICAQPMEGWDATPDGRPTDATFRRWQRFGESGAKLVWGGEAVAVRRDGRANPNQLFIGPTSKDDLSRLREALVERHVKAAGNTTGLLIGLQLTHSGRYSVPSVPGRREPRIAYRHPILDARVGVDSDAQMLSDNDVRRLIQDFQSAAKIAQQAGFDFVDIKHCHGYLGHEFLSARTRPGDFGGTFDNRTRFLREIIAGIAQTGLKVGVRLSAFDTVAYRPDPERSSAGKPGPGIPEPFAHLLPYRFGFGVNQTDPTQPDLADAARLLDLLREWGVRLVNLSAGNPYANPHTLRPAYYPPSDGYLPPEDPLIGVARQMNAVRHLKQRFDDLILVGSGYSYLQEFLPNVAAAAVRDGWTDCVGIGRMLLSYPQFLSDAMTGQPVQVKKICRTFSDCTTAPRNGLPSGCYPLDDYYKLGPSAAAMKAVKLKLRQAE